MAQLPTSNDEVSDKEVLMPYVIRWPHKRVIALAASCCALLVTAAPAAAATSSCPVPQSSPVFSVLGDQANYSLVPGGSFDSSAPGWTLNNASLVSGGEPWNVSGATNPGSVSIAPGGSAKSPAVCVSSSFPTWRFFAKSDGTPGATLQVWIQWTNNWGLTGWVPATMLQAGNYTSWQPTSALPLGSLLPAGVTLTNRFVFVANGGTWNIDDVYVDPYAI
jgi:hypothetical protein